jgi:hypothetical protein
MSKRKPDPLIEALKEGQSYTWTVPDGGNRASMRKAIQHGQILTMSPITDPAEIQVGDMVLVKWHGSTIFHLVGEMREGRYLIVNSLGGENGWVEAEAILGRVTKIVDGEPRPAVMEMLEQLEAAYGAIIAQDKPDEYEKEQFVAIANDLRWYAGRLGEARLDEMPRSNKWTFTQNLWHLLKEARQGTAPVGERVHYFIDRGKQVVGLAAELYALFEYEAEEERG